MNSPDERRWTWWWDFREAAAGNAGQDPVGNGGEERGLKEVEAMYTL